MNREPVVITNAITEVIRTLILLGIAFGLTVTQDQLVSIMLAVGAIMVVVNTLVTRSQTSPSQDVQTALDMPKGSTISDLKDKISENAAKE